jgi:hypothetical protein
MMSSSIYIYIYIYIHTYRSFDKYVYTYNYTEGHKINYLHVCIGLRMMSLSIKELWMNIYSYIYTYIQIVYHACIYISIYMYNYSEGHKINYVYIGLIMMSSSIKELWMNICIHIYRSFEKHVYIYIYMYINMYPIIQKG